MDSDIKTRVTPADELKLEGKNGRDCLVVIYTGDSHQFGKRYELDVDPILIGRGSETEITLESDSVSRRHAVVERRGRHYFVRDLDSTNGTYVNDELVGEYQLRRGDQIKLGDTIFKFLSGSDLEAQYHETIYRMTIIDGLTSVHNKRYLLESLEKEISRARRHERPLAITMFDVDHFKRINDNFGHLAGDYVLKELATIVRGRIRPDDIIARYGGEEFALVLPETSLEGGIQIAKELRALIEAKTFEFEGELIEVTISAGVAELDDQMDVNSIIKEADDYLYRAKNSGRNCVRSRH